MLSTQNFLHRLLLHQNSVTEQADGTVHTPNLDPTTLLLHDRTIKSPIAFGIFPYPI